MRIEDLKYSIGVDNIAAEPPEVRLGRRDLGRMLLVDRKSESFDDRMVLELPNILQSGDLFVLNNSKRMPGVLHGRTVREDASVELRFAGLNDEFTGTCRIYPEHYISVGSQVRLSSGQLLVVTETKITPHGLMRIQSLGGRLRDTLHSEGKPITSFFSRGYWNLNNYNNFYATEEGSIESPMAGMHLTPELIAALQARGIAIATITLHSVGSWLPFIEDEINDHKVMPEQFNILPDAANAINHTKDSGGRIIACGSTVMRTLETSAATNGRVSPGRGETTLSISPGYSFRIVDAYFTNFHTYRSSLMVLDSAFCPLPLLLRSYAHARDTGYLFHEFGDAVLYV